MQKFVNKIEIKITELLRMKLSEEKTESVLQFLKFCIVGVSNTVISYVLNIGTLLLLAPKQLSYDYFIGNIVSFVLSVLWSFYWNNRFVFKADNEKRVIWKALLKTYMSYGFTGIILNNVLSYVWIDMLGISKLIAPFINLIISVPLNFIINKFWAFKTEK